MTRLCLIGNSHLACLKLGWDRVKSAYPEVEVTCFASPGSTIQEVEVKDGCLVPADDHMLARFMHASRGKKLIQPDEYDLFIVVGLRINMGTAIKLVLGDRADTVTETDADRVISSKQLTSVLTGRYRRSPAVAIIRMLRSITQKPIILCPQPMPSERIPYPGVEELTMFKGPAGEKLGACARAAAAAAVGDLAQVIWQPASVTLHGMFTPHEYTEGSARLAKRQARADDFSHMNSKFGEIYLLEVFKRIGLRASAHEQL